MKTLQSKKGIALLLVISAILLLTTIVVDFAYNSNVNYNIAMNEKDRLQASYLAQTGYQFALILIRYDRDAKDLVKNAAKKLGRNVQVKPLYKMLPISSELFRGLASISGGQGAEGADENSGVAQEQLEKIKEAGNMNSESVAKGFLSFEGDFSAEVDTEDGKIPLNSFYYLVPTQPEYDRLKLVLASLLRQPEILKYIQDKQRGPEELANRIADYIDKNDSINENGGSERGNESSVYSGSKGKAKNAKLVSVEELILVPGITEDILNELKKHVTVYGSGDKVNACAADDSLLKSLIVAFSQRGDTEPIRADNEERLNNVVTKVKEKCPNVQEMSQALNEALGISSASPSPAPSGSATGTAGGTPSSNSFANMITANENFFRIESRGSLENAEVKLTAVIDASNNNPDQWKILYWRIQ